MYPAPLQDLGQRFQRRAHFQRREHFTGDTALVLPHIDRSGRVDPLYIIKALQEGADGVLVAGCHPGDCHYISGNLVARRKFAMLRSFLEYAGIEPERVQFSWVSASEGGRFASLIEKVVADVKKLKTGKKMAGESRSASLAR